MQIFNYLYQHIGDNIQIHTNGCDICIHDARKFANTLPENEKAIVYNTCSVFNIREVENKLILELLQKAFPLHKLYILGCDVNNHPENYSKYSNVFPNEQVQDIIKLDNIKDSVQTKEPLVYIKIQDGCPHKCSFCIINKLRSNPYSVPYKEIVHTLKQQIKPNARVEIAGTELTTYYDESMNYNLVDVLKNLIKDIPEIGRITLTSIDPHPPLTKELIKLIGTNKNKFVPHLVLAVQSGSDKILQLMNRRHTVTEVKELHKLADKYGISLGWDIIVGFPDETEEDFKETYNLMGTLKPLTQTIFEFSPREGTPAYTMNNQIPSDIKHKRLIALKELMKTYTNKDTCGFDSYAEYTEELTKYDQVKYIKNKIANLLLTDEATFHFIDLNKVEEIASIIRNPKPTDIIRVNFNTEDSLKCEIYINFFKEFIPDTPIIVNIPPNFQEDINEFEKVYHCKVTRA